MSEIHAVRARMLSHVVYMTEHSQGGGRKIEQPLSLYRFTSFRFPRYFQRAGTILSVYLCLPSLDSSLQEAVALAHQPSPSLPTTHSPGPPLLPVSFHTDQSMWAVVDPDIPRENPVEDKHRRLVRSHRSSPYDRELKPNTKLRDELGVRSVSTVDWYHVY